MVAGENDKKEEQGATGFAGLFSLVSDVDVTPPPATTNPINNSSTSAAPIPPKQPSPQQPYNPPQQPSLSSSGRKWVVGVIIGIGVLLFVGQSGKNTSSRVPIYSPPVQNMTPDYTAPLPQPEVSSRPVESKPPVGQALVFSQEQIAYCLAEDIRMDGAKSKVNNYNSSDVDRFNAMVADYNSRCSRFSYRSGTLENVRSSIELYRNKLYSEGAQRFTMQARNDGLAVVPTQLMPDIPIQQAPSASTEGIPAQLMRNTYGAYYPRYSCWRTKSKEGQDYCMQITRVDNAMGDEGGRTYVIATGQALDEKGELGGPHVQPGLVGAFVVKNNGNAYEMVASNPQIPMGTWGSAPTEWEFVRLGPQNYWGWQSEVSDMHQGYEGRFSVFLAIYGKEVRKVGEITSYFSNEGAVGEDSKEITSIKASLRVDVDTLDAKVYPLLVTITGKKNGKNFSAQIWKISFDENKWKYLEPKDWPLAGAAF